MLQLQHATWKLKRATYKTKIARQHKCLYEFHVSLGRVRRPYQQDGLNPKQGNQTGGDPYATGAEAQTSSPGDTKGSVATHIVALITTKRHALCLCNLVVRRELGDARLHDSAGSHVKSTPADRAQDDKANPPKAEDAASSPAWWLKALGSTKLGDPKRFLQSPVHWA